MSDDDSFKEKSNPYVNLYDDMLLRYLSDISLENKVVFGDNSLFESTIPRDLYDLQLQI